MFFVKLATSEELVPGTPRVEFSGFSQGFVKYNMPVQGRTLTLKPFEIPSTKFKLDIHFYLNDGRVGVVLGAARDNDLLTIFASPIQKPNWAQPGVLYLATVFHGDGKKEPCDVSCEDGNQTLEECCVNCESGGVIVQTCC